MIVKKEKHMDENNALWNICDENHTKEPHAIRCNGSEGLREEWDVSCSFPMTSEINYLEKRFK